MYSIVRNKITLWSVFVGLVILVGIIALSPVLAGEDSPEATSSSMTYTQQLNRTLTIGDVTVELEQTTHSSDNLELRYSYYSTQAGVMIHPTINGHSLTRADGSVIDFPTSWAQTDDGDEISKFELSNPIPGGGETLDVSLGSYITPVSTDSTGTALIEFAPNFGTAYDAALNAPGAVKPIDMPLQAELLVDERQYRVTKMTVFPISFQLEVVPVNEAGRKVELWGVDSSSEATLTDNTGASYYLEGGSTGFDDLSPRGHTSQQFIYQGVIPPSVSSLTLTVSGGGEIVGPFVFDNIALVSEDIPSVTPTPPGGVGPGDPIPTPPSVKD